jgi:tetratricopeptide (TPR) repeat protein
MDDHDLQLLLNDLKHTDEAVRNQATQTLWQHWFCQKGVQGLKFLEQAQSLMMAGQHSEAEALLSKVIDTLPDFAEAWNRRAVLYYVMRDYRKALLDCDRVIELVPIHFGALHGKGLCQMALGNYTAAIQAFKKALEVQPYALINQKLILECTAKLS